MEMTVKKYISNLKRRNSARKTLKTQHQLTGGPFNGQYARLTSCAYGDGETMTFRIGDQVGRYVSGTWMAA